MITDGLSTGQAARRLGISIQALRAWTRRYGYPPYSQTPGGHRRYSLVDVEQLALSLKANDGMVRPAIDEARHSADVYTVCPYCRQRIGGAGARLVVRIRRAGGERSEDERDQ